MSERIPFTEEGQSIGVGAHVCAMHENPNSVLSTLARTFQAGLRRNERCAYIAPEAVVEKVRRAMRDAGTDVPAAESEGRLIFVTDREPLLKDGAKFDPEHLLDAIKNLFTATLEAGYAGLRLSADVPWISHDVPGSDRIMEFETLADEVINNPGVPLLAICQYRLTELEPEDSLDILQRHPLTLVGAQVHLNEKYAG